MEITDLWVEIKTFLNMIPGMLCADVGLVVNGFSWNNLKAVSDGIVSQYLTYNHLMPHVVVIDRDVVLLSIERSLVPGICCPFISLSKVDENHKQLNAICRNYKINIVP
jgi:hypothetical protein